MNLKKENKSYIEKLQSNNTMCKICYKEINKIEIDSKILKLKEQKDKKD